jgi:hypothetical protein
MDNLRTFELQTILQLLKYERARIEVDHKPILAADLTVTIDKIEIEVRNRTKIDES